MRNTEGRAVCLSGSPMSGSYCLGARERLEMMLESDMFLECVGREVSEDSRDELSELEQRQTDRWTDRHTSQRSIHLQLLKKFS